MSVLVNGEIVLTGFVGDSFWGEGFTHREVLDALAEIGRSTDVNVRLNSGGGYVDDGKGIYNAFAAHKGKVVIYVEGIAASAASVIAMAGDEIVMRKGATMMIHDPLTFTYGNSADHKKSVEMLEVEAENLCGIYADRSGKPEDECRDIMVEEIWYTAEDAVAAGFADKVEKGKAKALASFDYSLYEHAPEEARALAKRRSWNLHAALQAKMVDQKKAASSAATPPKAQEPSMTEKSKADEVSAVDTAKIAADAATAAQKRISAILDCEEAKGREAQARHIAFNTQISAEDAKGILSAGGAPAKAEEEKKPGDKPDPEAAYAQRKAGGDSLAGKEEKPTANAAAGWKSVVDRLNGRAA